MQDAFLSLKISRKNIWGLIKTFSEEQINQIPEGWNNNLAWNYGHVIVTQQLICYNLSGLDMLIDNNLINKYRKGTKPESHINLAELNQLKTLSIELAQKIEEDYNSGKFTNYKAYMTSFGLELKNIEQAIHFNNIHEGIHLGYCMALIKALS